MQSSLPFVHAPKAVLFVNLPNFTTVWVMRVHECHDSVANEPSVGLVKVLCSLHD